MVGCWLQLVGFFIDLLGRVRYGIDWISDTEYLSIHLGMMGVWILRFFCISWNPELGARLTGIKI